MQRKRNLIQVICLQMGKTTEAKSHRVILRSPFLRIHYYQNKWLQVKESQYLIPTYSWTLTPIPNWTCSVMTISPFQCTAPSTWLTNYTDSNTWLQSSTREGCWLQSFSIHLENEDYEVAWSQNPTVYKHSSFFKN